MQTTISVINELAVLEDLTEQLKRESKRVQQELVSAPFSSNTKVIHDTSNRILSETISAAVNLLDAARQLEQIMSDCGLNDTCYSDCNVPDGCIDAQFLDNCLMVKAPSLPVAAYRKNKPSRDFRPIRFPLLDQFINNLPVLTPNGNPLVLYIIHIYPINTDWCSVPDFDNYDIKGLIDTLLSPYGGDNISRYTLVHSAAASESLAQGTYALLTASSDFLSLNSVINILTKSFSNAHDYSVPVVSDSINVPINASLVPETTDTQHPPLLQFFQQTNSTSRRYGNQYKIRQDTKKRRT